EESNYLKSPDIVLKDEHKTFKFHIIKEDVYPPKNKLKYTQHPAKYPIPHNYVVRTMYSKKKYIVECLIVYIDDKLLYQIYFGEYLDKLVELDQSTSHAAQLYCEALVKDIQNNKQVESKSRLSEPLLFGLCYKSVEAVCKIVTSNELEVYRSLARLDEMLIRAGAVYNMRQEITNRVNEKIPISL
ncbi:3912_t:CDS:2, partial [Dentiscutata heterogama]